MSRPMKNSGLEWIEEIPEGWSVTQLGRIGKFSASGIDKKVNEKEVPVKIINYTDIYRNKTMIIDSTIDFMEVTCSLDKRESHLVEVGDIIFTPSSETIEEIGRSSVVYETVENLSFSYHVLKYHPLIEMNLSFKKYLCNNHFLYNYFSSKAVGTIRKTLNRQDFKLAPVLIPTIKEQQKIADFLDEKTSQIDSIIENTKQSIIEFKKYKQALITETVTKGLNPDVKMKASGIKWIGEIPEDWEITKFKYEIYTRGRLGWKGLTADEYVKEGKIFLATPNIKGSEIDFTNVNYITDERYQESPEIMLSEGDVLLTKDGSTLGTVNVIRFLPKEATVNSSIAVLTPSENLHSLYLYNYIKSSYIQNLINRKKDGMGVPHLFQKDIREFNLLLPEIQEQQQIANYLDEKCTHIDSLIADKEQLIREFEDYKKALIFEYVTGKKEVE